MGVPINYIAVIVAAVAAVVLGFLWYGPLFGKRWMELSGHTRESIDAQTQQGMAGTYVLMVISTLIMSYVLAHAFEFASTYLGSYGLFAGLAAGFWNWLGFVMPISLGSVLWDRKPWSLWFITAGYYLVALLIMGVILALWP